MNADIGRWLIFNNTLERQVRKLADFARAGHIDDSGLTSGFRKFLVAQMTASRCSPDIRIEFAEQLSEEETTPASHGPEIASHLYFDLGDAKDMSEKLREFQIKASAHLTLESTAGKFSVLEKIPAPIEAENWFGDVLHAYQMWTPEGSEIDILHQRATMLTALVQSAKRLDEFPKVAEMAVTLLATSGAQKEAPAEWMWQVKSLASAGGAKMLDLYRVSGNPGLVVYATYVVEVSASSLASRTVLRKRNNPYRSPHL